MPEEKMGSNAKLTHEEVKELVQDEVDRGQKYLEFTQNQAKADRAYFKHLFDRAVYFLGALILAAGIFGYRSVDQLRDEVKGSVNVALQKGQSDLNTAVDNMKSEARKELDATRVEVRKRIED